MSIAQHFVAGEGSAHPCSVEFQTADYDAAARAEFTCDTTNLPWIIFRAAHRANHLSGLSARARALLAALARTVDADRPYAAIYASRELLTGRAMHSMRTLYRGLDDLEATGFVVRAPQKRFGEAGLFGRAYLHLTEQAARLLGFVEPAQAAPGTNLESSVVVIPAAPEEVPTEATPDTPDETSFEKTSLAASEETPLVPGRATPEALSLRHPSATLADGAIYKDLYPASQKRQPGRVPRELQRLLALGFHENLIFKYMKTARLRGKRLSDIVEVCWDHLKLARHPICYLRALILGATDFSVEARRVAAVREEQARTAEQGRELIELRKRIAGQTFFDHAVTQRLSVSNDGHVLTVQRVSEVGPRTNTGDWLSGFATDLAAGDLLPSAAELNDRFEAARSAVPSIAPPRFVAGPTARLGASTPRQITPVISEHLAALRGVLRGLAA